MTHWHFLAASFFISGLKARRKMSVTSGNWTNGSLGPGPWFPMASATESPWTPLSTLQISALLLGVTGPLMGLKVLETGSHPFKPLCVTSADVITENSGQATLPEFLGFQNQRG